MASVELRQVRKDFGDTEVIHGVDVSIADGEFVVLVGPSGCGKSTLLRMVAGLEELTSGEIRIGGRVVNHLPPKQRDIAMVFQSYALYPHMTAFDNMAFSLKLAGKSAAEVGQRVDEAARILGLGEYLDRYPRELSGGQRQRVAMGRAIVRKPQVFLFDEPLSNLDARLRVQMRAEIRELHGRLGTTSIYVTHDQVEAMSMADRIVVLNKGQVEQVGAPLELYDDPGNIFVAGFIGSPAMNLLRGRCTVREGMQSVELAPGCALPVALHHTKAGCDVIVGVRPEHLDIAHSGIPVEVAVVEPMGADTQIHCRVAGHGVTALSRKRHAFHPGERIHLAPMPGKTYVFDAESGTRLH